MSNIISGKHGLIRGNILGKKSDRIGRAVISCDSSIPINSVVVPRKIAMTLTIGEKATSYNYEKLRKLFENGSGVYPGANFVIK